ncbi:hypothetical protein DpV83gp171 [Deerpox virus W-848-83]|uniref:Uncharacterized protein n=1 Tax=Deerpox virus (strain Mule deer/United States/W-848-83/1983) TaxID=305674 RepID=Q08FI1_DPV83|nr:hypothetical protein DpV83gp002 [Deerpox virus W-848-83]YP_227546.1 hypothetical protein DpV83gp171 [Deerpox virus W-848-83]ABI99160.1 hypothetical protein DpV83gp002 [Deerpox virus W-848-83]ABI99326.1 hypothetical protein DpV83gp171 [Deerpox virus W-848-83]
MLCIFYLSRLCNLIIYSLYSLSMYPMKKLISFMFGELNPFHDVLPDPHKKDDDAEIFPDDEKIYLPIMPPEPNPTPNIKPKLKEQAEKPPISESNNGAGVVEKAIKPEEDRFNGVFDFMKMPNPFKRYYEYCYPYPYKKAKTQPKKVEEKIEKSFLEKMVEMVE